MARAVGEGAGRPAEAKAANGPCEAPRDCASAGAGEDAGPEASAKLKGAGAGAGADEDAVLDAIVKLKGAGAGAGAEEVAVPDATVKLKGAGAGDTKDVRPEKLAKLSGAAVNANDFWPDTLVDDAEVDLRLIPEGARLSTVGP